MKRDTLRTRNAYVYEENVVCKDIIVKAQTSVTHPQTYGFQNHGAPLSDGDPADRRSLNASFSPTGPHVICNSCEVNAA